MQNVARTLSMDETGFLARHGITHLIHDGDGAFTQTGFVGALAARGVTSIRLVLGSRQILLGKRLVAVENDRPLRRNSCAAAVAS
jgi:hypothetical protein